MSSTSDKVYSGAAQLGRVWSLIGAVFGTILAILMGGGGVYLLFIDKSKYTASTTGTVESATCTQHQQQNSVSYSCDVQVHYTVDNHLYVKSETLTSGTQYSKGMSVTVLYDPQNPANAEIKPALTSKDWGFILIGVSMLVLLLSWGTYWLTRRYKSFAALEGVNAGASIVRGIV